MSKYEPRKDKEYLVTDQCYWETLTPEEREKYNPYDKDRFPHGICLIDPETGTLVNLLSGSIIKVIKAKEAFGKKKSTPTPTN